MSGLGKRIVAAGTVIGTAAMVVTIGVSVSSGDEPKAPKPQNTQPAPQLPFAVPDPGEFGKTQEQFRRALESMTKNPNDPASRKMLNDLWVEMMKGLPGGLPGFVNPARAPERPRLGVRIEPLAPVVADQLGLDAGVAIAGVVEGSAAEKAGFKAHDILVEFAGKGLSDPADLVRRLSDMKPGEKVDAVVVRKGKRVELKGIDLPGATPRPAALGPPVDPKALENNRSVTSVSVSVTGDAFTISATEDGVRYLVTGKVGPGGASAEKVSVKAGDETVEAADPAKVPEKYRGTVERLLKLVGTPRGKVTD
ncbi:S1C family serine protease [Frigoriglobus tundricola]|uniref:PDZ domain-containing protein n=1 Tax=Frigoriglobus tundricola TaxID=2774151 RepID=A0A6M5YQP1_9BACT|nr:PDZ domain-containing protein [Frigoriglobus tundricola]QJW96309.1 hypothetical protein FTUN_3866 [Frigoriglobus tundricola]